MYLYIIAIGWTYVVLMMSITEKSIVAGVLTFVFYGVLPLSLVLWFTLRRLRHLRRIAKNMRSEPLPPVGDDQA